MKTQTVITESGVTRMKLWTFVVPGKIWGYRQGRREAFRPDRVAFKRDVRLGANIAGVPGEAEVGSEMFLDVRIHWKRKARIDGKNVCGLIEDALWTQDRGVAGNLWIRYINQPREEVVITVKCPIPESMRREG